MQIKFKIRETGEEFMKKKVFRETLKRIFEIERKEALEEFIVAENFSSTFESEKHRMKMREDYSSFGQMNEVYEDLQDLERADLFDLRNCGEFDGKYNKKRRNIFC